MNIMTTLSIYLLAVSGILVFALLWYLLNNVLPTRRFNNYFVVSPSLQWDQSEQKQDHLLRGSLLLELLEGKEEAKGLLVTDVQFSIKEFHIRNFDKLYLDAQGSRGQKLSVALYIGRRHVHLITGKSISINLKGYVVLKENKRRRVKATYILDPQQINLPDTLPSSGLDMSVH